MSRAVPGIVRGCGTRREGGIYLECGVGPYGRPLEFFLADPPEPMTVDHKVGVELVEGPDGLIHVLDWVGESHYPFVTDFLEECLLPDEPIVTSKGVKPLASLQVGDLVLTHLGRFRPVIETMNHTYSGDLLRVRMKYWNQPLNITPEHPVLIASRTATNSFTDPTFVPAAHLKPSDYLCMPRYTTFEDTNTIEASYKVTYPAIHGNRRLPLSLRDRAQMLRSPRLSNISRKQHQLLRQLAQVSTWSYAEIKRSTGNTYRYESGMARALRALIRKQLLTKTPDGVYQLTSAGERISRRNYASYAEIGHQLGVSNATAMRLVNPPNLTHVRIKRIKAGKALMQLIGYYLAEGSVCNTLGGSKDEPTTVEFSFGKTNLEKQYAHEVHHACGQLGIASTVTVKDDCYHVLAYSKHLAVFLVQQLGRGAHSKCIPAWVLNLSREKLQPLFDAYINGDGHINTFGFACGTTVSRSLASGLRLVASKLGFRTAIGETTPRSGSVIYRLTFYPGTKGSHVFSDEHYIYVPVTDVSRVAYTGPVHNLAVADDESYVTMGCAVHNCRRYGLSRLVSGHLDLTRLRHGSRIFIVHAKGLITNHAELRPHHEVRYNDPFDGGRLKPAHQHHCGHLERTKATEHYQSDVPGCSRDLWTVPPPSGVRALVTGTQTLRTIGAEGLRAGEEAFYYRQHASTSYRVYPLSPEAPEPQYTSALVASIPITNVSVIKARDGSHQETLKKVKRMLAWEGGYRIDVSESDA